MAYKKPKLNQVVFVINEDEIYKEKVEFLGEDTFLYNKNEKAYWYENYNMTWAKTFSKAKEILISKYNVKQLKLEKHQNCNGDWWSINWAKTPKTTRTEREIFKFYDSDITNLNKYNKE